VSVRADAIDIPIVLGYGAIILGPLLAFQTAVEAAIVRWFLPMDWKEAARMMFWANVWSIIAGIPTKIFNEYVYHSILPKPLHDYMRMLPAAVAVGSCVYFVVTIGVEWLAARQRISQIGVMATGSRLLAAIIMANTVTYAICAPIFYRITKPTHNVAEFTSDSKWAKQPPTEFFYISTDTGFLRRTRTDGTGDRLVAPIRMTAYLVKNDLQRCVFRGEDEQFFDLDLNSGKWNSIPGKWDRWTRVDEVAFWKQLSITNGGKSSDWFGWTQEHQWSNANGWRAYAEPGLGSSVIASGEGKQRVIVADNPGWIHLASRHMENVIFVNDRECLFDDRDSIYLLDVEKRRVGYGVHGTRFAIVGRALGEE
jgi:hypothetical protein